MASGRGKHAKIRALGAASVVAILAGLVLIWLGSGMAGTAGPVLIILGIVSMMLAVGVYLDEPKSAEPG